MLCRSAKLVAAGIYAVLTRQGFFQLPKRVVIAVEGGVYEKYRHYSQMLEECVWSMVIEVSGCCHGICPCQFTFCVNHVRWEHLHRSQMLQGRVRSVAFGVRGAVG